MSGSRGSNATPRGPVRSHRLPFRRRRWLGIPAPVVAALVAVMLVGGVAFASIFFLARVTITGNVKAAPDLRWVGTSGDNLPCVIPAPGMEGGSLTPTVTPDGQLQIVIDAYPQAEFDLWAWVSLPDDGGSASLRIEGIDLGNPAQLTATLKDTFSTATDGTSCQNSFGTAGSAATLNLLRSTGDFLTNGSAVGLVDGRFVWAVHMNVRVNDDAPTGPITGVAAGLRVVPATP